MRFAEALDTSGQPGSHIRTGPMHKRQPLVAVVDDDACLRKSIATLLKAYSYRVELYESAKQFLATKSVERPACLILDVYLGSTTGIELSQHLVARGIKVPTIFVSGSRDQRSRRQALELGCVAFVEKPFVASVLIEAVATAIAASRD